MEPTRITGLAGRLHDWLWSPPREDAPPRVAGVRRLAQTLLVLGRDVAGGQLTLRAMSLVYTTLLSIVPMLALSFSVLKAFGVSNQVEPLLLNYLAPLGEKGVEVAQRIVQFIANMNVGVLGAVGLALLLYTAISLLQKIEESLNFIWHVPAPRGLGERFSRYLSVLLVGPILMFSALGLTATVTGLDAVRDLLAVEALSDALRWLGRLLPYAMVAAALTFTYVFIPNTPVRLGAALAGGVAGGLAWQTAGWAFAAFVASSTRYSAIYSGLAILVLFMIWIYLSWLILLFGASVAFYVQHPEYLVARGGEPRLSNRMRERLALSVAALVAQRFAAGQPAPTVEDFTRACGVPQHALRVVLDALEQHRLVARTVDEPAGYVPAREPQRIPLRGIVEAVRSAGEDRFLSPATLPVTHPVASLVEQVDAAVYGVLEDLTMRDLVADPAADDTPASRAPTTSTAAPRSP